MKNLGDILWHTIPAVLVGVAFGFVAGFGLRAVSPGEQWTWGVASTLGLLTFLAVWPRREQRQHGGEIGGSQSWLEAFVPVGAGLFIYAAATLIFYNVPI